VADDRRCRYCAIELDWRGVSFDHVVPFVRGGANDPSNLASSCITCQRGKFTKSPAEWAQAKDLMVPCEMCKKLFKPRWADYVRGYGRTCSRNCSGLKGGQAP
jgi:hypothetical protein